MGNTGTATTRLTAQGQTSIPAPVRRVLGLVPGDAVEWTIEGTTIRIRRAGKHTFADIRAVMAGGPTRHLTLEQMKESIAKDVRQRHARR